MSPTAAATSRLAVTTAAALGLALALCLGGFAGAARADVSTTEMEGKVGPYAVGVNMTIRDHVAFVAGHYFYVSRLTDIPLTGRVEGETVTVAEPGGGVFHLHFVSNESAKGQPLNFYNSTGLQGTWTKGSRTLPVSLSFSAGYNGPSPDRWYADVTNEPDAAFEARVRRFLRAVIAGDKAGAAKLVSYPLRVNGAHPMTIRTAGDLIARWGRIFPPTLVAQLRGAIPHEMFVHDGKAMVSNGLVWFDAKGASAVNEP